MEKFIFAIVARSTVQDPMHTSLDKKFIHNVFVLTRFGSVPKYIELVQKNLDSANNVLLMEEWNFMS